MDIEDQVDIEAGDEAVEASLELVETDETAEIEAAVEAVDGAEETIIDESVTDADTTAEGEEAIDTEEELSSIKDEILKLREELTRLEELREKSMKMFQEFDEFVSLFPEQRIENLPDEVWNEAKRGASLAAAYALYEKRREAKERLASQVNAKNAALSAGKAGEAANEYFSYEQVKGMSQAEVRKNYSKIRESMKKWN